jgi:hypothetical protein
MLLLTVKTADFVQLLTVLEPETEQEPKLSQSPNRNRNKSLRFHNTGHKELAIYGNLHVNILCKKVTAFTICLSPITLNELQRSQKFLFSIKAY